MDNSAAGTGFEPAADRGFYLSHLSGIEMTLFSFLLLLLIAAICGALGQALAGYSFGGCLVSILVGFVGAVLGMWLANQMDLPAFFVIDVGGEAFPVVWSILGSAVLALGIGILNRRRRRVL